MMLCVIIYDDVVRESSGISSFSMMHVTGNKARRFASLPRHPIPLGRIEG